MYAIKRNGFKISILIVLLGHLADFVHAQENYEVRNLRIEGNRTFSSALLKEKMSTRATGLLQRWILRKSPFYFSAVILQSDVDRLVRFYQKEGFLHVAVASPTLIIDERKKKVGITLTVDEGEPVRTGHITGRLITPDSIHTVDLNGVVARILPTLQLREHARFRDESLENDRLKLARSFSDEGYPYVTVQSELTLHESGGAVDIRWIIDIGPRCIFGDIEISDNRLVPSSFILERLAFQRDSTYDQSLIDKSQEQLYALGLFQIVSIKARLSQSKNPVIPVEIQIKEAPRLMTKLGVGYGREDEFRTFINLRRLGFLGDARRIELLVKHSGLEPYNVDVKFTQPLFLTPRTALILNPFLRKEHEPGYAVQRLGGRISLLHTLSQSLKGSISYVSERVDQYTDRMVQELSQQGLSTDLYNKSGVILGLTFDSSAPIFNPSRGMFIAATLKANGLVFKSDYRYSRLLLDMRRYQAVAGSVLAMRIKVGNIVSEDSHGYIPVEDRFYTGGSSSVRGWSRARLGPLDENDVPTGGNSVLEGSVELRTPIVGMFSGVLFADFGNVWRGSNTYPANEIRYALGVGLRFETLIGPIRLDVGRPVLDEEKRVQVHFSVGHAF